MYVLLLQIDSGLSDSAVHVFPYNPFGLVLAVLFGVFVGLFLTQWLIMRPARSWKREPLEVDIDADHVRILQRLIKGVLTTEGFNEIAGLGELSPEAQRRRRAELLHDLNELGHHLFGRDLITRGREASDRRIIHYKLNPSVRGKVLGLLRNYLGEGK